MTAAVVSGVCESMVWALFHRATNADGETLPEVVASDLALAAAGEIDVGATDPLQVLADAATGDVDAMRTLADAAIIHIVSGLDTSPFTTAHEGALLGRMAAARTNASDDHMRVVYLLGVTAQLCAPEEVPAYAGEAIARLELIADSDGPMAEQAAKMLAKCGEGETAETMKQAKQFRARLLAAKGAD